MTDKPKISHFDPTGSSEPKLVGGDSSDRSGLAGLYPKPKTYEQRERDRKILQRSYRRRWPKYPYLNIAAYGSVVYGLMIWFIQNLNGWWFSSSDRGVTMSTVFFSFATWLLLVFLLVAWVNYVNSQLYYFGGVIRMFWAIYSVLMAALIVIWLNGQVWEYTNTSWVLVLAAIHFVVVFFSAQRSIGRLSKGR